MDASAIETTGSNQINRTSEADRIKRRIQRRHRENKKAVAYICGAGYAEDNRLEISKYGLEYTKSTFQHMMNTLDYAADWQAKYDRFANKTEYNYEHDNIIIKAFLKSLEDKGLVVAGIYGEGEHFSDNTYNHESILDNVLDFTYATIDKEPLVFIRGHCGGDVRSNYSTVRVFRDREDCFLMWQNGYIACENNHEHNWSTDDGYHWYDQGSCGCGAGQQLEKYDRVSVEDFKPDAENVVLAVKRIEQPDLPGVKPNGPTAERNILLYDENEKVGFCPFCQGKLIAG